MVDSVQQNFGEKILIPSDFICMFKMSFFGTPCILLLNSNIIQQYKYWIHCTNTKTEPIKKQLKSHILLDLKYRCMIVKSQLLKDLL